MYIIKKLDTLSLAKFTAVVSALLALIPAIFFVLFGTLLMSFRADTGSMAGFAAFSFLLMPLFAALAGFIYGLLIGFVYNLISRFGFSIKMDLAKEADSLAPASPEQNNA